MTRAEFIALPYLLTPGQVASCGYSLRTIDKFAENGILTAVCPKGATQRKFQKKQIAAILGWDDAIDQKKWDKEKPLMGVAVVREWTGYQPKTVRQIGKAGGLTPVQPGGIGDTKYRKDEIGKLLGF